MKDGLAEVTLTVPMLRGHGSCASPESGRGWVPFSGQTPRQEATGMRVAHLDLTGTSLGIDLDMFSAFL